MRASKATLPSALSCKPTDPRSAPAPQTQRCLVAAYKELRGEDAAPGTASAYRITVRQLEALVRLSEAMARVFCSPTIRPSDVEEVRGCLLHGLHNLHLWGAVPIACHLHHPLNPHHPQSRAPPARPMCHPVSTYLDSACVATMLHLPSSHPLTRSPPAPLPPPRPRSSSRHPS